MMFFDKNSKNIIIFLYATNNNDINIVKLYIIIL